MAECNNNDGLLVAEQFYNAGGRVIGREITNANLLLGAGLYSNVLDLGSSNLPTAHAYILENKINPEDDKLVQFATPEIAGQGRFSYRTYDNGVFSNWVQLANTNDLNLDGVYVRLDGNNIAPGTYFPNLKVGDSEKWKNQTYLDQILNGYTTFLMAYNPVTDSWQPAPKGVVKAFLEIEISDITGLQTALNNKVDLNGSNAVGALADAIARRHDPVTLGASSTGLSLSNQVLSIAAGYGITTTNQIAQFTEAYNLRHTHGNKPILDTILTLNISQWVNDVPYASESWSNSRFLTLNDPRINNWEAAFNAIGLPLSNLNTNDKTSLINAINEVLASSNAYTAGDHIFIDSNKRISAVLDIANPLRDKNGAARISVGSNTVTDDFIFYSRFSNYVDFSWRDASGNKHMSLNSGGVLRVDQLSGTGNRLIYADLSGSIFATNIDANDLATMSWVGLNYAQRNGANTIGGQWNIKAIVSSDFAASSSGNGQIFNTNIDTLYLGNPSGDTKVILESSNWDLLHYRGNLGNAVIWTGHNFNPDSKANIDGSNLINIANWQSVLGITNFGNFRDYGLGTVFNFMPNDLNNLYETRFSTIWQNTNNFPSGAGWAIQYGTVIHQNLNQSEWTQIGTSVTGSEIAFRHNSTGGGVSNWHRIWNDGNFDPNTKVDNMQNAVGLGFSSGDFNLAPYIYHTSGQLRFLATQQWVGGNYAQNDGANLINIGNWQAVLGINTIANNKVDRSGDSMTGNLKFITNRGTVFGNNDEFSLSYTNAYGGGLNLAKPNVADGVIFIKDNLNVGIGKLDPIYKLDVDGQVGVQGLQGTNLSTTNKQLVQPSGNSIYFGNPQLSILNFESIGGLIHYRNGAFGEIWTQHNLIDYKVFGLGNAAPNAAINIDVNRETGFYNIFSGQTSGAMPFNYGTIQHNSFFSVEFTQLAISLGSNMPDMAFRNYSSGTGMSSWFYVATQNWVSNNFASNTSLNNKANVDGSNLTNIANWRAVLSVPTNNNQLANGANYITSAALAGYALISQIPTDNAQLSNGAGYITAASLPTVNNGALTFSISADFAAGAFSFSANQAGNTNSTLSLSAAIKSDIALGVSAYNSLVNYLPIGKTITINGITQLLNNNPVFTVSATVTRTVEALPPQGGGNVPIKMNKTRVSVEAGTSYQIDDGNFEGDELVIVPCGSSFDIGIDIRWMDSCMNTYGYLGFSSLRPRYFWWSTNDNCWIDVTT